MTTKTSTFDRAMKAFIEVDKKRSDRILRRKMIRLWYSLQIVPGGKATLLRLRRLPLRKVLSTNRNYF